MGRCWSKSTTFQLFRINKSRDLMYNMMVTVNNNVLNTRDILREYISGALTTKKMLTM